MKHTRAAFLILTVLSAGMILSGCRTPTLGEGYRNEDIPEAKTRTPGGNLDVAWEATDNEWAGLDESMLTDESAQAAAREKRWEGVSVYFAYDRATVGAAERPKVETLATFLKDHPNYYVIIEGHCDERGSDEYNRALGERRALAVRDYLVSLGIADSRIQTLSYGEERPALPDATTEAQHAKNRRCEFVLGVD